MSKVLQEIKAVAFIAAGIIGGTAIAHASLPFALPIALAAVYLLGYCEGSYDKYSNRPPTRNP
jgi:hypothetical protein